MELNHESSEVVEYLVDESGERYMRTPRGDWYYRCGSSWESMERDVKELEAARDKLMETEGVWRA